DRSGGDRADVASAGDRDAEAEGHSGAREPAGSGWWRSCDAAAARKRHRSVFQAAGRTRSARHAAWHAAGRADRRDAVQLLARRAGLRLDSMTVYCVLSASTGSVRIARRPGMTHASSAAPMRMMPTAASVIGSLGVTL